MQKIRIDFNDNPDLQMALMNKEPGEDCEITVKLSTIEANDQYLEGSVDEITYEYDGEEMSIEPTEDEPVGIDMFTDIEETMGDEEDEVDMEVEIDPAEEEALMMGM